MNGEIKEYSNNHQTNDDEMADLLINIAKDEYSKEIERISMLDNKAGILMTIVFSVITVSIPKIPFETIISLVRSGINENVQVGKLLLFLLISSFGGLAVAVVFLYRSIQIKEYNRFGITNIEYSEIFKNPVKESKSQMFHGYQKSILENHEENEKKSKEMKNGIIFCIYGFSLLIICFLITNIALIGII